MKLSLLVVVSLAVVMALAGCISAPYVMKTDRVDQKMELGNRGYLKGTPPPAEDRSGLKRPLIAVDIDLPEANTKESAASEEIK